MEISNNSREKYYSLSWSGDGSRKHSGWKEGFQSWQLHHNTGPDYVPRLSDSHWDAFDAEDEEHLHSTPCGIFFENLRRVADPVTSRLELAACDATVRSFLNKGAQFPPTERIYAALDRDHTGSVHVTAACGGLAPFLYRDVIRCVFFVQHVDGSAYLSEPSMVAFLTAAFTVIAAEETAVQNRTWDAATLASTLVWQIFSEAGMGVSRQHLSLASFDAWLRGSRAGSAIRDLAPRVTSPSKLALLPPSGGTSGGAGSLLSLGSSDATVSSAVAAIADANADAAAAQRFSANCSSPGPAARALGLTRARAGDVLRALQKRAGGGGASSVSFDAFAATVLARGAAVALDPALIRACEVVFSVFARDDRGGVAVRELGAALATCCAPSEDALPDALFALYGSVSGATLEERTVWGGDLCAFFRSIALFHHASTISLPLPAATAATAAAIDEEAVRCANGVARRVAQHCLDCAGHGAARGFVAYDTFMAWWKTRRVREFEARTHRSEDAAPQQRSLLRVAPLRPPGLGGADDETLGVRFAWEAPTSSSPAFPPGVAHVAWRARRGVE